MFKKSLRLSTLAVLTLAAVTHLPDASAQTPATSAKTAAAEDRRLAVALNPTGATAALRAQLAGAQARALDKIVASLDQQLLDRMQNTGVFRIIARTDLEEVLKDQELQSVFVNPDDANLPQAFAQSAAKYLVQTTVDDFADQQQVLRGEGGQIIDRKRELRLSATLKIYDVTTGELHTSESLFLTQQQFDEPIRGVTSSGDVTDRLNTDLATGLSADVANRVLDKLFPARVIAKTGEQITINRGVGTGIAVGQPWTIFATGQQLVDPYTGVVLGTEEAAVGQAVVTRVNARFSTLQLTEDFGVHVGTDPSALPVARPNPETAGHGHDAHGHGH